MAHSPIEYRIDASDRITYVNSTWDAFADANNGAGARASEVVGRSLWDFITDVSTREIYRQALARIRAGVDLQFSFRCDAPECARLLEMTISRADESGSVAFWTREISETRREIAWTSQGDGSAPAEELLRVCGWCNRVDVHGEWMELEDAVPRLKLMEFPEARMITHGICESCLKTMMAEVGVAT